MWEFLKKKSPASAQRQDRFLLEVQISYRKVGDFAWNHGKTQNLSRSGVLFRAAKPLDIDTPVEIQFIAPPELESKGGLVACRGSIVRWTDISPSEHRLTMAAKFKHYEVVHRAGQW